MEKVGKSTDPVQQTLRDHKKNWNLAVKEFIKRVIAFKRTLNGRGDTNYSLPPSTIKDPLPSEVGSFMNQLANDFELIVSEATKIQQEQDSYSKNRKKSKKELEGAIASIAPNLIKTAVAKNIATLKIADQEIKTLVAISEEEQVAGLMHVPPPAPVMTFVYAKPRVNMFWMKNTPAPLDIVFSLGGIITAIHEGEPYSTKMIGDYKPSDLVVELAQGSCQNLGIKVGDPISILL